MGKPSGNRKAPESKIRMNFLHQAAESLVGTCPVISANLCGHIKQIGQKAQIKIHRDIKRKICKGCNGLLKVGVTADAKVFGAPRSQKKIGLTCHLCATRKAFLLVEQKKKDRKKPKNKKSSS